MNTTREAQRDTVVAPTARNAGLRAAAVSLVTAVCLGIGLVLILFSYYHWTPLPLAMTTAHVVLLIVASGIAVAVGAWRCLKHSTLWFLCLPSTFLWVVVSSSLLLSFSPIPCHSDFIFDCAAVKRGDSIDDVELRMRAWWRLPATGQPNLEPGEVSMIAYKPTDWGEERFVVFFDTESREVVKRCYIRDLRRY